MLALLLSMGLCLPGELTGHVSNTPTWMEHFPDNEQQFLLEMKETHYCYLYLAESLLHVRKPKRKHWWRNYCQYKINEFKDFDKLEHIAGKYSIF